MTAFEYRTRHGVFAIRQRPDGRWWAMLDDEGLGSYHRPQAALDDLLGDHCFSNARGVDTSEVGLPEDLSEWSRATW